MAGAVKPNLTFSVAFSPAAFLFPSTAPPRLLTQFRAKPATVAVKCSVDRGENGNSNGALSISNLVGQSVEELLNREENKGLLKKLNDATERVDRTRKELADIQRQEAEARQMRDYIQKMETYATEIAECQREVSKARVMMEEAELSLSMNIDNRSSAGRREGFTEEGETKQAFDRDKERWESVKAASISAVVGSLASLPVSLAQATPIALLLQTVATTFASCALFGITFRYVVRRDLDDPQLKTGAALAFGVVKGLARLGPLELNTDSFLSDSIDGALLVSQDIFIFLFAAVGLDLCFKLRLLSPFPIRRSTRKKNQGDESCQA